jgi:hypothetical protein
MPGAVGRLEDRFDRRLARLEVWGEAALVADAGFEPRSWRTCLSEW